MILSSQILERILERVLKLPPAQTRDVVVRKDLQVPMRDGVVLLADHYAPRGGEGSLPTVLVRGPYGRRGGGFFFGRIIAERGYQVLLQGVRGTDGSGGAFDPFRQERDDGLDTLRWIEEQPWYCGDLLTFGASYLGFTQWAMAAGAGEGLKGMSVQVAFSDFYEAVYPGGAFALQTFMGWISLMSNPSVRGYLSRLIRGNRKYERAFDRLPLRDVDRVVTGREVPYYRRWLEHDAPGDSWWASARHGDAVAEVSAPAHLLGGWYDFFLPHTMRDYASLRAAGKRPYLTIGPWHHSSFAWTGVALNEALAFFDAHTKGEGSRLPDQPVRVYVTGAEEWRYYPDFPPPETQVERWYLNEGGRLAPEPAVTSQPDRYRYYPADPTPSVGGPLLATPGLRVKAGPVDNGKLEMRPDVLLYTSDPLARDLEVIGPVAAELLVRSSLAHTDFFARLCDVHPSGRSVNVCDAILRAAPGRPAPEADGTLRLRIELWPTAHRIKRNHQLRLQVSSGAHPRYARNTGSGEPLATATKLVPADQEVFHDPEHPSSVILTVLN
jgi:putative CocE/NonD family hydrolase